MKMAKTATEALKLLWAEDFFQNWKKYAMVVIELAKKRNHFSDAELGMALKRAKYLTRRGKRGNFEYIEKHAYVEKEKK